MYSRSILEIIYICILVQFAVQHVDSSSGDRDQRFQMCVSTCTKKCAQFEESFFTWGCKGDCQYGCMFIISKQRLQRRLGILQYYGKWPFYRMFGFIQEPASFIFSLMNLTSQILGWLHYRKKVSQNYEFYHVNKAQFCINSFAWICAAIFHTRDTYWTEKMDYFSAALAIAISLFTCIVQIIGKLNNIKSWFAGFGIMLLFGSHICYMAFIHFDYGYNVKFLVVNGILNISIWLVWCWMYRIQRPYVLKCAFLMGGTLLLASLEILDFPPIWWTFDSHSLWHLGTTPVAYMWFCFLAENANYEEKNLNKLFID